MVDWSDTLEAAIASGNEERLVGALRIAKSKDELNDVVGILRKTHSSRVRNAAAIALADMHAPKAASILIDVISKPETKNYRGTLLYALEEIGAKVPLRILADIILCDTYEARQEALRFITSGNIEATRREFSRVLGKLESSSPADDEQAAAVREAISALEGSRNKAAFTVHRGRSTSNTKRMRPYTLSFTRFAEPVATLTNLPRKTVEAALKTAANLIVRNLEMGKQVRIQGLGVLKASSAVAKARKSIVKRKKAALEKGKRRRSSKDVRESI